MPSWKSANPISNPGADGGSVAAVAHAAAATGIRTHAQALIRKQRLETYRRNDGRTMIWV